MNEKEYEDYIDELRLHGTRELAEEVYRLEQQIKKLNNIIDELDKDIDIIIDEIIETNKGMVLSMNYLRVRLHDRLNELKGVCY